LKPAEFPYFVHGSINPRSGGLFGVVDRFVQRIAGGEAAWQIRHHDPECRSVRSLLDDNWIAHLKTCLLTDLGDEAFPQILLGMRHDHDAWSRRVDKDVMGAPHSVEDPAMGRQFLDEFGTLH
jgi:hypothetical protein